MMRSLSALLAIMLPVSVGIAADLERQLRTCAAERDDALRLACFDRLAGNASEVAAAESAAPANQEFGVRGGQLAPREEEQTGPESIAAKVTSLQRQGAGERRIALDNGQVWVEKQADQRFDVRVGDEVTVKRAAMRSYRMVTASGRSTRVTRVQ